MLTRAAAIPAAALLALGATAGPAAAIDPPVRVDRGGGAAGSVTLHPRDPGSGGGSSGPNTGATDGDRPSSGQAARPAGRSTCTYQGHEIGCTSADGVWSADRGCYVQRVSPQPDPSHPSWAGHTDGTVYQCTPPGAAFSAGQGLGHWFWAPDRGAPGAPELVDPVTLAEQAIERMHLVAPRLGVTPDGAGSPLLVGMDAWYWVADAGPRTTGPIRRTATAGSVSVTANAEVGTVTWETGDGASVTCRGPGTPWAPERGTGPSPTCGHRYERASTSEPGAAFTVRATAHWRVTWTGAGQSGVITFTLTGQRDLEVTELQVLQTG